MSLDVAMCRPPGLVVLNIGPVADATGMDMPPSGLECRWALESEESKQEQVQDMPPSGLECRWASTSASGLVCRWGLAHRPLG